MGINYINKIIKFGKYEHMKSLQEGKIFARPLGYFQKMEQDNLDKAMRHDKYEGTFELRQPKTSHEEGDKIFISNKEGNITKDITSGIIGPMRLSNKSIKGMPVFCMYSINSNVLEDYKKGLIKNLIDPKVEEFGDYALVIDDYKEFIERVSRFSNINVGPNKKIKIVSGIVDYVDVEKFHGNYGAFKKPYEYSYQSEFRIAFERLSIPTDHTIIAPIGDISDISTLMPYNQFKKIDY